jgi:NhaP-type Na+/H+ or K+/H+ antiporter
VVLFVLGLVSSVVYEGCNLKGSMGAFGESHEMWMQIDPHLLLFTLLPALLTGDAMTIDTTVAKRVGAQCIYLAGPGVLINSGLTGLFLYEFVGAWPPYLCLTMGAILAATDPVAVVGLLKELGASPTLTVQIQGESLLNDGTAIVLFKVCYDMLCGVEYDLKEIFILFVYMVICSWFLGMVIGGLFSSWIGAASNRLEHDSSLIQISLTICCAYTSFIFAEGIIGISGVLCTVAASLMLADNIWPRIVSSEAMHEVWHVLEYIGNTLIFFLAGALTGSVAAKIEYTDYIKLLDSS